MLIFFFLVNSSAQGQNLYFNLYNDIYKPSNKNSAQVESSTAASTQVPHDQYQPPGINVYTIKSSCLYFQGDDNGLFLNQLLNRCSCFTKYESRR